MSRLPTRGDVDPRIQDIREQLIIEVLLPLTRGVAESRSRESVARTASGLCYGLRTRDSD